MDDVVETASGNYVCTECNKSFDQKSALGLHLMNIHLEKFRFFCEICHCALKTRMGLKNHLERHIDESNVCPYCKEICNNLTKMKQHILTHGKDEGRPLIIGMQPYHVCKICNRRMKCRKSVNQHFDVHIKTKKKCPQCGDNFENISALKQHMIANYLYTEHVKVSTEEVNYKSFESVKKSKAKHTGDVQANNVDKRNNSKPYEHSLVCQSDLYHYSCEICGKYLRWRRSAERHVQRHINENNSCPLCKLSFEDSMSIREHMSTHVLFSEQGHAKESVLPLASQNTAKFSFNGKSRYVCDICKIEFGRETFYDDHMNRKHGIRNHECIECNSRFVTRSNLCTHVKRHHYKNNEEIKCEVCNKIFLEKRSLKAHVLWHSEERPFKCNVCEYAAKSKACLKEHQLRHSSYKKYICQVCGKRFTQLGGLAMHRFTHTDEYKYKCDVCDKLFKQPSGLLKHKRTHFNKEEKERTRYACQMCDKSFLQKWGLTLHERKHRGELNYRCATCGKYFISTTGLKTHEKVHSQRTNSTSTNCTCDICGKGFSNIKYLKNHQMRHSETAKRHACEDCGKKFYFNHELKTHQRTHTGERPYICEICGKSFTERSSFFAHVDRHSGIERFVCDVCNKCFNKKMNLTIHKRIHTGCLPYSCRFCSKRTVTKTQLTNHERSHTGEKPYACDMCLARFSTNYNLKQHKLIHFGIKNFPCQFCDKRFRNTQTRKLHELTHTGTKPHKCHICDMAFTQKQSLKTHVKIVHESLSCTFH